MATLPSSMRLKVKKDTFFLPTAEGEMYFRNNENSFHMKGTMIEQWIEKVMPMFDGSYSLEELTKPLPKAHQQRVYEIAQVLYENGFIRDMSQDEPHQLDDEIVKKFSSQIAFLDNLAGSGGYRFQCFRQQKVLAVGEGSFFISLVSSLLEAGLPTFQYFVTDVSTTNKERLLELIAHEENSHKEVTVTEVEPTSWEEMIAPFQWVLYVGDVSQLSAMQHLCKEQKKQLLFGICTGNKGIVGEDWELIGSRVKSKKQTDNFSLVSRALLANVIVFELLKRSASVGSMEQHFFMLDLKTMVGKWHKLAVFDTSVTENQDLQKRYNKGDTEELFAYFRQLAVEETGIFRDWGEGDLSQLPLSQCRVQVEDIPEMICSGCTHEEARKEAGLCGVELYVASKEKKYVAVGAGETFAECVYRGLQKCLAREPREFSPQEKLTEMTNSRCQFYLRGLEIVGEQPEMYLGEKVLGFPVVWVKTRTGVYSSVDVTLTLACSRALQQATLNEENTSSAPSQVDYAALVQTAREILQTNGKVLNTCEVKWQENVPLGVAVVELLPC